MTRAQKIWDFVFGVALIAGAPIVTFFVAAFAWHFAASFIVVFALRFAASARIIPPVVLTMVLMLVAAAFVGACIWRKTHRVLPGSFFVAEIVAAIFASVLFMLVFFAAGYADFLTD